MRVRGIQLGTFAAAVLAGWQKLPAASHVFLCLADHFEPEWHAASATVQRERVARWVNHYADSVAPYCDSRGRHPQHTFFCPIECYQAEHIESLAKLVRQGLGDIEVHLHHDNDHAEHLREVLCQAIDVLHQRHGLLSRDRQGRLRYGFIHGNWALDNSHPNGRWCGVNNELSILRETGCYADFTLPAAPHPAQTRTINSIYYAVDDPLKPKSHDTGIPARVGAAAVSDGLLMVQGPLLVRQAQLWCKPRLENGNIANLQPPTLQRVQNWLRARIKVCGQDEWLFIKLHTHGAPEKNADILLGPAMHQLHASMRSLSEMAGFEYYYVTAREMAQLISQAERGATSPDFNRLSWA